MDGRNVFDILPWKIRCITSYRFRYKKGHAENISLLDLPKPPEMLSIANHGSLIEL